MLITEKARQSGEPIPNVVPCQNIAEFTETALALQVSRLARLYAVNAAMAETLAPLVFLEALR
jgi:hypothetical protein